MKKKSQKLELHRETLNALQPEAVQQAVGGGLTQYYTCFWETGTRCDASVCICD